MAAMQRKILRIRLAESEFLVNRTGDLRDTRR
jgi:hypothetical protein